MKFINKFVTLFIIMSLISGVSANGIPDEPMVIYGSIQGLDNSYIEVSLGENKIQVPVTNGNYGTDKTFDLDNKISLDIFQGEIKLSAPNHMLKSINSSNCSSSLIFQAGKVCNYDFIFEPRVIDADSFSESNSDFLAETFQDLDKGLVFEADKGELKSDLGSFTEDLRTEENIFVTKLDLEIVNKVEENLLVISDTEKEALFIPKDTSITQSDVVIEKPREIENISLITSSIGKNIVGAVDIPTNKPVTFSNDIRVCTKVSKNIISGLRLYYSQDSINWNEETNYSNLIVKDFQACFDVNHLTSYAISEEASVNVPKINRGGGGGSGGRVSYECKFEQLECNSTSRGYLYFRKQGVSCGGGDLGKTCNVEKFSKKENVIVNNKFVSGYNLVLLDEYPKYNSIVENIAGDITKKINFEYSKNILIERLNKISYTYKGVKEGKVSKIKLKKELDSYTKTFRSMLLKEYFMQKSRFFNK